MPLTCSACKHCKRKFDRWKLPGQMWCDLHQVWVYPKTPKCESSSLASLPKPEIETIETVEEPVKPKRKMPRRKNYFSPSLPKDYRAGNVNENCALCRNSDKHTMRGTGWTRNKCEKYNYAVVNLTKMCDAFESKGATNVAM